MIAGNYSKEAFYKAIGVTRQFLYKRKHRKEQIQQIVTPVLTLVNNLREKFKRMGSRRMFYNLNIQEVGINRFEKIVSEHNLTVVPKKRRIVTTQWYYEEGDINLLNGRILNDVPSIAENCLQNEEIPVASLGYMTPVQYEEYLKSSPLAGHKTIKLYDFNEYMRDFLQA